MKNWKLKDLALFGVLAIIAAVAVTFVLPAGQQPMDKETAVTLGNGDLNAKIELAEQVHRLSGFNDASVNTLIKKARAELVSCNECSVDAHKPERSATERDTGLNKALAHLILGNTDVGIAMEMLREKQDGG